MTISGRNQDLARPAMWGPSTYVKCSLYAFGECCPAVAACREAHLNSAHFLSKIGQMRERPHLGSFELIVMLAVIRLGNEAYGVPISREIEKRGDRSVTFGSLYATLERLGQKGLISSELGEPTPERGGRAKKYFRVTTKGLREVRAAQRALQKLWQNLPQLEARRT